jgi:hypothetical protein
MAGGSEPEQLAEKRELIAETPNLRMIVLTLDPGEVVPGLGTASRRTGTSASKERR